MASTPPTVIEDPNAAHQRKTDKVRSALGKRGSARPHLDSLIQAIQADTGMGHDEAFWYVARWFVSNLG